MLLPNKAAAIFVMALAVAGCDPRDVEAVRGPGGPFRPGAGCVAADLAAAGAQNCVMAAPLGFERMGDETLMAPQGPNLSDRRLSCRRSYCGAGSLGLSANYRWPPGATPDTVTEADRMGTLRYTFASPVDLYNKTLSYALYLDGPVTPINALVAVVHDGRFRLVDDGAVLQFGRWTTRGGVLRADNALLQLPAGTTSLVVTQILISVYLATDVRTGDREHWSGDFYLDDVRWD